MTETDQARPIFRSAGYTALVERYGLDVFPNWHTSRVTSSGIRRVDSQAGIIDEVYPHLYWPGDKLGDHLEFALKYDGTNLAILARLFQEAGRRAYWSIFALSRPESMPGDYGFSMNS